MAVRFCLVTSLLLVSIFGCSRSSSTAKNAPVSPPSSDSASSEAPDPTPASAVDETTAIPSDAEERWERVAEQVSKQQVSLSRLNAKLLPAEDSIGVLVEKAEGTAWWDVTKKRLEGGGEEWTIETSELKQDAQYFVSAGTEVVVSTKTGEIIAATKTDHRGIAKVPLEFDKLVSGNRVHSELTIKAAGEEETVRIPTDILYERLSIENLYQQARTAYVAKQYEEAAKWAKAVRLRDAGFEKSKMLFLMATDHHLAGRLDEARRAYLSILLNADIDADLKALTERRIRACGHKLTP